MKRTLLPVVLFVLLVVIGACTASAPTSSDGVTPAAVALTGVYETTAQGRNGDIKVRTTLTDSAISKVEIISHTETAGLVDASLVEVPRRIVEGNTLAVDAVSGATITSNAIVAAVGKAIEAAGGNTADYMTASTQSGPVAVEEMAADVVVIGAGASGVTAATAAAESGAKVILLEKTGVIGGASNLSWAGRLYNTPIARASGIEEDVNAVVSQWVADMHWRVDASAVRQFVVQSSKTYDWLKDRGYETKFMKMGPNVMYVLPDYSLREGMLRTMLTESVGKNGGAVLTNTTGRELIVNDDGHIVGVYADKMDGTRLKISASYVVIATGGYAANAQMVKEHFGFEGVNGGLGQNVGEGLEMAWAVGAKVPDNFGGQMLHQTLAPATVPLKSQFSPFKASYPVMLTYLPQFMNVGFSGARFRNEEAAMVAVEAANTSAFQGPYHYAIVSQQQLDKLEKGGMAALGVASLPGMPPEFYADFRPEYTLDNPWKDVSAVMDAMVAVGAGYKGETPEELALNAGLDVATFVEEFQDYTGAIRTGDDVKFGKQAKYLVEMGDAGPYYAIKANINNLGSIGGLLVNTKFQVLNDKRVPIKGLYGVGVEAEGTLFNDTYVGSGIGIGYAFTSGILCGQYIAEDYLSHK